jgi:tetratricopeptide (TPR) repeat protein/2-polyprenyl-3-methyl-5-hydroxy-6-metoxy-1,4-benzoquinol methylase
MELTIEQALQQAVKAHKAGNLQDAEALYRAILQAQPKHPDANHNLGVIAVSLNKSELALPLFKVALEVNSKQVQFWISYVDALIKTNQFEIAKSMLEKGKNLGLTGEVVDALEAQLALFTEVVKSESILQKKPSSFTQQRKKISVKKEKKKNSSSNPTNLNQVRSPSQVEVNALLKHCQKGQFDLAENLAKTITHKYPDHQFGWKVLGVLFLQTGRVQESLIANQRAVAISPNDGEAYRNLGNTLKELGRLEDAEISYTKAIAINPEYAEAHNNLGNTLKELDRLVNAETSYKKAIAINLDYAEAHYNLGITMKELGRLEDAEASYSKAISIKPGLAEVHYNLGITLKELGRLEDAEASYNKAISIKPDYVEAHNNLGNTLKELGRLEDAETSYKKAIGIKPENAKAHSNLGITLRELGRLEEALFTVIKSIKIKPTAEAKSLFIELTKKIEIYTWDQSLVQLVITAILEPWGRPSDLISFACRLLRVDKEFSFVVNQVKEDEYQSNYDEIFLGLISKKEFAASTLLDAMLSSSPIPDAEIEIFLSSLRRHLLKVAVSIILKEGETEEVATIYCSLAQQCFINEYVYFQTPEEIKFSNQLLNQLTEALEDRQSIPSVWLISVACYFPLYSIKGAEKLLQKKWSDGVEKILIQQIQEPLEELILRASIGAVTSIENQVSLVIQSQYEENPYPRWVRLPKDSSKKFLNAYMQSKFPLSPFRRLVDDRNPEILIAGCGTGQHSIGASQEFKGAKILAIDLSMASLSYAKRKTAELAVDSIEYAQADLLKLNSLGRTFNIIESSGVLHHLENPFEGWAALLSLLRPHGLMRLGFYSELARQDIVRVRNLISNEGIGSTSQEIRDYRKHLLELNDSENYGFVTSSSDFFSTSACRDLLFHVQEHRMNLNILADFLIDHDLNFLGFDIDSSVIRAYKKRFSNDPSATNLDQWHIYEEENPDTFISMYQFWTQKKH